VASLSLLTPLLLPSTAPSPLLLLLLLSVPSLPPRLSSWVSS